MGQTCKTATSIPLFNCSIFSLNSGEDKSIVEWVIRQLCNELLPIAYEDAQWLARIHKTKQAALHSDKDLPALARFLDSNLIMNYLNGEPWYDVHPLLIKEIMRGNDTGDGHST